MTFTVRLGVARFAACEVKKGWRICGVQVGAILANPEISSLLMARWDTRRAPEGGPLLWTERRTIQVKIPTRGIGRAFEQFEGKTYTIRSIQHVTVFVKKKKK